MHAVERDISLQVAKVFKYFALNDRGQKERFNRTYMYAVERDISLLIAKVIKHFALKDKIAQRASLAKLRFGPWRDKNSHSAKTHDLFLFARLLTLTF